MIPNAVATTGPYAGLWSHLKSIDHALKRILAAETANAVTPLDRDRLRALVELLECGLGPQANEQEPRFSLTVQDDTTEPNYSSAIDIRPRIIANSDFQNWQRLSKKGYEAKLQRLIDTVESYLDRPAPHLFLRADLPNEEFKVISSIVGSLLTEAEVALN